jgi:excisionase family DNA binding protein
MKEKLKDKIGEVVTLQEAGEILGFSRRTIYRYVQERIFTRFIKYPGGGVRLYLEDVLAFRRSREVLS